MCRKCNNILCFGCDADTSSAPKDLTDADKQRLGWNDTISPEEYERLQQVARNAVETPNTAFNNSIFKR